MSPCELNTEQLALMAKVMDVMFREGVTLDVAIEYCRLIEQNTDAKS